MTVGESDKVLSHIGTRTVIEAVFKSGRLCSVKPSKVGDLDPEACPAVPHVELDRATIENWPFSGRHHTCTTT